MKNKASHFSLSLPAGEDQDNVPALLRKLAESIEAEADIEILDIVFHDETNGEGDDWPSFTVYYTSSPPEA